MLIKGQKLYKEAQHDAWLNELGITDLEVNPEEGGGSTVVDETNSDENTDDTAEDFVDPSIENEDTSDNDSEEDEVEENEEEVRLKELESKDESELTDEEKQEIESIREDLKPLVNKLRDFYGYDELKEKVYSNDTEGHKELAKDVAQIELKNNIEAIHSNNPLLAQIYDHVVNKGLSEELFAFKNTEQDYETFDIKEEVGQQQTLSLFYKRKGLSDDEANDLIEGFKNKGVLDAKAKTARQELDKIKQEQINQFEQEEFDQIEIEKEYSRKVNQEIDQVFKSKRAGDYPIPDEDIKPLQNFIYGKNKEGVSVRDEAYAKLTTDQKVLYEYILMKGLKVKGLDVKTITDRISFDKKNKQNADRKGLSFKQSSSKGFKNTSGKLNLNDIDMSKAEIIN